MCSGRGALFFGDFLAGNEGPYFRFVSIHVAPDGYTTQRCPFEYAGIRKQANQRSQQPECLQQYSESRNRAPSPGGLAAALRDLSLSCVYILWLARGESGGGGRGRRRGEGGRNGRGEGRRERGRASSCASYGIGTRKARNVPVPRRETPFRHGIKEARVRPGQVDNATDAETSGVFFCSVS